MTSTELDGERAMQVDPIGAGDAIVETQDSISESHVNPIADVEIVIPVYNEEGSLEASIDRLRQYLSSRTSSYTVSIMIADNASTDATPQISQQLAARFPEVSVVRINQKGRGRALKYTWSQSMSPVVVYMDADLSTDLHALDPLVAPLLSGHSDVSIGSRLRRESQVSRGAKREIISRTYNFMLRAFLRAHFSDAQCGFKAIRTDAFKELAPYIKDTGWFFDTELLVLAERAGMRIHEVPVDWVDDPNSSVDIMHTAIEDIKGIFRMIREMATGKLPIDELRSRVGRLRKPGSDDVLSQVMRFAIVGVGSTVFYGLLFWLFAGVMTSQWANALAMLVSTIANTAANRRYTFDVKGKQALMTHHIQALGVFGFGLVVTSGSLAILHALTPTPGRMTELLVLTVANLVATVIRFGAMRLWIFRKDRSR